MKINENQWKSMKIVRGLAESMDLIDKFRDFENFDDKIVFFVKNWIDSCVNIKDCTRIAMRCPGLENFVAYICL